MFNFSIANFNTIYEFNTYLNDYNLNTFQYRLIKKLCNFVRNVYISKLPESLSNSLVIFDSSEKHYSLRYSLILTPPDCSKNSGELTFSYFSAHFVNNILKEDLFTSEKFFEKRFTNNDILFLQKLLKHFKNFDV